MKNLYESILDDEDVLVDNIKSHLNEPENVFLLINKKMRDKVLNSNEGETDIFGRKLKEGDLFVSIGNIERPWTSSLEEFSIFYIPKEQRNNAMHCYKFSNDTKNVRFVSTDWGKGKNVDMRPDKYLVKEITGKIKWPIKINI